MANYRTPGVYIEEISKFPPSVAQVATAIPAFIGYTQIAKEKDDDDLLNKPKRITSLLEYERFYGTTEVETGITITIEELQNPDGRVTNRVASGRVPAPSAHNMYYALQAYFRNGGGPCYIVSVERMSVEATVDSAKLLRGLGEVAKEDEITLILFPESQSLTNAKFAEVNDAALRQCGNLQDRFVVMDMPPPATPTASIIDAATLFRGLNLDLANLKYGAAYAPNLETTLVYAYHEDSVNVQTRVNGGAPSAPVAMSTFNPANNGDGTIYAMVKTALAQTPVVLPPSPLVVGVYAKVDASRGVWKAPANESLAAVINPTIKITHEDQEELNVHTSGKSINAIRSFMGKGTLIWGARTLDGNSNEWRYVSVRRFFNMVEESTKKATERFVFEPNDANTWVKVRAMIENFLIQMWNAGALQGATPEKAFFVKVGLGETMTALDILEGRMNVEIGMAVVRPAEFIILKFSHKMPEA